MLTSAFQSLYKAFAIDDKALVTMHAINAAKGNTLEAVLTIY